MLSRCKNCNYYFFEAEKDYICCSNCGQIIKENFPQQPLKRATAYFEVISYQQYIKKVSKYPNILLISIALFYLVSFSLITGFFQKILNNILLDLELINMFTAVFGTLIVLFPTLSKHMLYHKAMANSTFWWKYATSFSYRILKWFLLSMLIYFVMRYVTKPLMLEADYKYTVIGGNVERVKRMYYTTTLLAFPLVITLDILDYFRYRRARKLDKKRFM